MPNWERSGSARSFPEICRSINYPAHVAAMVADAGITGVDTMQKCSRHRRLVSSVFSFQSYTVQPVSVEFTKVSAFVPPVGSDILV
jgi:hypothetical protein